MTTATEIAMKRVHSSRVMTNFLLKVNNYFIKKMELRTHKWLLRHYDHSYKVHGFYFLPSHLAEPLLIVTDDSNRITIMTDVFLKTDRIIFRKLKLSTRRQLLRYHDSKVNGCYFLPSSVIGLFLINNDTQGRNE